MYFNRNFHVNLTVNYTFGLRETFNSERNNGNIPIQMSLKNKSTEINFESFKAE